MATVITMTGPGTTTVDLDPVALAIGASTTAMTANLKGIQAACNEINKAIREMKNHTSVSSKSLQDLQIAVASIATATAAQTVIQAAAASNQIKTNNFQVAATKSSLEETGQKIPVEPPIVQQITETVKDSVQMNSIAVAEGAVTSYISTQAAALATWIATTETYRGIESFLSKAKNTLLGTILPPTPGDVKSAITGAGVLPDPTANIG
jgi:hypothetical protein